MATDPVLVARHPVARTDDPKSELVAHVHDRSRTVIDAELRRLARRVPSLRRADLNVIDAALADLAESLILARLRNVRPDIAPLLRRLFDAESM